MRISVEAWDGAVAAVQERVDAVREEQGEDYEPGMGVRAVLSELGVEDVDEAIETISTAPLAQLVNDIVGARAVESLVTIALYLAHQETAVTA